MHKAPVTALSLAFLTAALAGCGGANTTPPPGNTGDPDFTLTAAPSALTVYAGQSATTSIRVARPANPRGTVTLSLEGAAVGTTPEKISGTFAAQTGGASTLTLNVGATVPVGTYPLTVRGTNGATSKTLGLQVKVEKWLLVDADRSANNWNVTSSHQPDPQAPASPLDEFMKTVLPAQSFDIYAVKNGDMTDTAVVAGPDAATLRRYTGVIWYTGDQDYQRPTAGDLANLRTYLNEDQRKVLLLSPALILNLPGAANVFQTTDPEADDPASLTQSKAFLKDLFGVAGYNGQYAAAAYQVTPAPGSDAAALGPVAVRGGNSVRGAFVPVTDAQVRSDYTTQIVNAHNEPATGSVVLRRTGVGTKHTSTGVLVGVSPDAMTSANKLDLLRHLIHP